MCKFAQNVASTLPLSDIKNTFSTIEYFSAVHLVAKPLIWSEAESDRVVIETSIY